MRAEYIIIILVCLVIAIAIVRSKRKDFKLEANKLIPMFIRLFIIRIAFT